MDREITERAVGAYGRALNIVDPILCCSSGTVAV